MRSGESMPKVLNVNVPSDLTQEDAGRVKPIEEIRKEGREPIVYGTEEASNVAPPVSAQETSQVVRVSSMQSLENSRKAPEAPQMPSVPPEGGEKIA